MIKLKKIFILLLNFKFYNFIFEEVFPSLEFYYLLRNKKYRTILDIGAHKGQFTKLINKIYNGIEIHSFEPQKRIFNNYLRKYNYGTTNKINFYNFAIGDKEDKIKMNISNKSDSSSLKKINELQHQIFPGTEFSEIQIVNIKNLDDIFFSNLLKPLLLKVDVQGYELEILKSLKNNIQKIDEILIEVSFEELYEGQALEKEIDAYLSDYNFRLKNQINNIYKKGKIIQCDRLYIKN